MIALNTSFTPSDMTKQHDAVVESFEWTMAKQNLAVDALGRLVDSRTMVPRAGVSLSDAALQRWFDLQAYNPRISQDRVQRSFSSMPRQRSALRHEFLI